VAQKVSLKSKYINKVILSTDSEEYKKIELKFGAEILFLRKARKNKTPLFYSPNHSLSEYFTKNSRPKLKTL
tara:strand:- start:547 stop:762 length:216 start_codon:yes stop_codon:yes gene_type:complete